MITRLKNLPFFVKYFAAIAGLSVLSLTIYRILFYSMYSYRIHETGGTTILKAFLFGARFDIMATTILYGIFLLMAAVYYLNRFPLYRVFWKIPPLIVFVLMLLILGADLIYYENANKHIGYEAYAYAGPELLPLLSAALEQNPFLFVAVLAGFGIIIRVIVTVSRKFPYHPANLNAKESLIIFLLSLALFITGGRGGWQNSPLRASDAIISDETIVNDLAVNAAFTVIMDMKVTKITKRHKMPIEQAASIVQKEISYPGAEFINNKYPLLRKIGETNKGKAPNIVIIVLEGWTGRFINPITDGKVNGKTVAPHFNRLIRKGLFFTRFFAAGGRTTNGLMALISGIPDRPGLTAVRTQHILGNFSGLGNILKSFGYNTLFVTGNDLTFNNKGSIMSHWGFDDQIGKKKITAMKRYKLGAWGFNDRDVLEVMHNKLLRYPADKPFAAVIHTVTTHYPYQTPDPKFDIFDQSVKDRDYLNVYHYADWAVNDFLETAKKSAYFRDTVFVLVSDHSHHRYLNYYEDRNVPFLLYAPGRITPGIRNDISSQLDIMPTILGIVGKETQFSSMGRDLLKTNSNSAYFAYGNLFGWIEGDIFYFQSVEGGPGETRNTGAPFADTRLCKKDLSLCDNHYNKTKAFLNLSYELLNTNRIFPPKGLVQGK